MENKAKVRIDAHVVRQLGDELITSHEQAILELVKNSYDADANYSSVEIDTNYREEKDGETLYGRVSFFDDGHGMSRQDIERGWLTISFSGKRSKKQKLEKTEKGRNYQGDKGLGRLSSMRLGRLLRITTSQSTDSSMTLAELDWGNFTEGNTLDSIPVKIAEIEPARKGTRIDIIGLEDIGRWRDSEAATRLQAQFTKLISPYGHLSDFIISLSIDGDPVDIENIQSKLHKLSMSELEFSFDGEKLSMTGKVRLPYYKGMSGDSTERYEKFIDSDDGLRFYEFLKRKSRIVSEYDYLVKRDDDWFVEFGKEKKWSDIVGAADSLDNPGKFTAHWSYVFLKGPAVRELERSSGENLFKYASALKDFSGINLYRDGFAIGGVHGDWVGLSSDKTSGLGFYSLRPENTFGYIFFDGYESVGIRETSDRQGLIENRVYFGFMRLVKELIKFSNIFLNVSRKAANEFITECKISEASNDKVITTKEALDRLGSIGGEASKKRSELKKNTEKVEIEFSNLDKSLSDVSGDFLVDPKVKNAISEIQSYKDGLSSAFNEYERFLAQKISEFQEVQASALIVANELQVLNEKVDHYYDLAAIGLSASALSHDINSQVDSIYKKCNQIAGIAKSLPEIEGRKILNQVNSVRATARTIAKDVSMLNPMLKGRRERIEEIVVSDQIKEYFAYASDKLKEKDIIVKLDLNNRIPIEFNPGKFYQIIDNLVRNSEYWLNHHRKSLESLNIFVETNDLGFKYWDSGLGIRDGIADQIFDPFVSDKDDYKSGLGLFIIKNLLKERDGEVELLSDLNSFGRKYIFSVQFLSRNHKD